MEEMNEPFVKVTLTQIYNEVLAQKAVMTNLTEEVKKQNHLRSDLDKMEARCKHNLFAEDGLYHKLAAKIDSLELGSQTSAGVAQGKQMSVRGVWGWGAFIFGITGWLAVIYALLGR